jgi:hypothetical protein
MEPDLNQKHQLKLFAGWKHRLDLERETMWQLPDDGSFTMFKQESEHLEIWFTWNGI